MGVVERYEEQREAVERLKSERERRKGSLETLTARLKDEFGCKNVADAEKTHGRLLKTKGELQKKLEAMLDEIEEKLDGKT